MRQPRDLGGTGLAAGERRGDPGHRGGAVEARPALAGVLPAEVGKQQRGHANGAVVGA